MKDLKELLKTMLLSLIFISAMLGVLYLLVGKQALGIGLIVVIGFVIVVGSFTLGVLYSQSTMRMTAGIINQANQVDTAGDIAQAKVMIEAMKATRNMYAPPQAQIEAPKFEALPGYSEVGNFSEGAFFQVEGIEGDNNV